MGSRLAPKKSTRMECTRESPDMADFLYDRIRVWADEPAFVQPDADEFEALGVADGDLDPEQDLADLGTFGFHFTDNKCQ